MFSLVIIGPIIGWFYTTDEQRLAQKAMADPNKIVMQANVVALNEGVERYRGIRGRKRVRTAYFADVTYELRGLSNVKTLKVDNNDYKRLSVGNSIELWAVGPNQSLIYSRKELEQTADISRSSQALYGGIIGLFAAIFLSISYAPFLAREPDDYMPEGVYTETSWLDIEDGTLVAMLKDKILLLEFTKKTRATVRSKYQNKVDLEEICTMPDDTHKLKSIPIDSITGLNKKHHENYIRVNWADNDTQTENKTEHYANMKFVNPAVRNHAFSTFAERLKQQTGDEFEESVTHFSRLKSARLSIIMAVIMAFMVWYSSEMFFRIVFLGGFLWAIKSLFARLASPTVLTEFEQKPPTG